MGEREQFRRYVSATYKALYRNPTCGKAAQLLNAISLLYMARIPISLLTLSTGSDWVSFRAIRNFANATRAKRHALATYLRDGEGLVFFRPPDAGDCDVDVISTPSMSVVAGYRRDISVWGFSLGVASDVLPTRL